MSEEVVGKLKSRGIDFACIEDAASAVMHLASDSSLNGRSLAILPRNAEARGYVDLQKDDFGADDVLSEWQGGARRANHRVDTDQAAAAK